MNEPTSNEAKTIFEHAQRLNSAIIPWPGYRGKPAVIVPNGWRLEEMPGAVDSSPPDRVRQDVVCGDHASFCEYVNRFKQPTTMVFVSEHFCSQDSKLIPRFLALIDYHDPTGIPSQVTHRVAFIPKFSVSFERWSTANNKPAGQFEFAEFIERNIADIVDPPGADLLHFINEFSIEGTLSFQRVQRLQNGSVKFSFQNEHKAKAGEIEIPDRFQLGFPVFEGEPQTGMSAKLRYRLSPDGKLALWFELENPHLAVEAATLNLMARVQIGIGIRPLRGQIPS